MNENDKMNNENTVPLNQSENQKSFPKGSIIQIVLLLFIFVSLMYQYSRIQEQNHQLKEELKKVQTSLPKPQALLQHISEVDNKMQNISQESSVLKKSITDLAFSCKKLDIRLQKSKTMLDNQINSFNTQTKNFVQKEKNLSPKVNNLQDISELAFELSKKAYSNGSIEMAQVYMLSALNHSPGSYKYLKGYSDIVLKHHSINNLNKLMSLLEISLYQVNPENIPNVKSIMEDVAQAQNKYYASLEKNNENKIDVAALYSSLKGVYLEEIAQSQGQLVDREEKLQKIIPQLENSNLKNKKELISDINKKLNETQITLDVLLKCKYIDSCLKKINSSNIASDKAVSIIQAAQNILPQFWGVDLDVIPEVLAKKINGYPSRINKLIEQIAAARSMPYFDRIKGIYSEIESLDIKDETNTCQSVINLIYKKMSIIPQYIGMIKSEKINAKTQVVIQKINKKIQKLREKQYERYNQKAVEICSGIWQIWKDTGASDDACWHILRNCDLAKIDQRLLKPEVGALVSRILSTILGELDSPTDKVKAEILIAETAKYRLEDF